MGPWKDSLHEFRFPESGPHPRRGGRLLWIAPTTAAPSVAQRALGDRDTAFDPVLERWASDAEFWIRRSALFAHLVPLRQGRGDFDRFSRFADAMLEEKDFSIRKTIVWVLRDTSRTRPDLVFDLILPRAHRASRVTIREAVKRLSPKQREAVLAAR
ncbi:DNA alkylation repair protein [Brevibacterium siliguriense]|uniref:DNA alkylation repair protein n=1 Tax=Brevibacterium siliguriense TaxID=1136497 RepID=UPI001E45C548|nr:DNA alkylation repair protein [Brevibacterium siliguriense]